MAGTPCFQHDSFKRDCLDCLSMNDVDDEDAVRELRDGLEALKAKIAADAHAMTHPSPPVSDDGRLKRSTELDETPTGAFGLPRWKYMLRLHAACLEVTDKPLTPEYRTGLADMLGDLESQIDALNTRAAPSVVVER